VLFVNRNTPILGFSAVRPDEIKTKVNKNKISAIICFFMCHSSKMFLLHRSVSNLLIPSSGVHPWNFACTPMDQRFGKTKLSPTEERSGTVSFYIPFRRNAIKIETRRKDRDIGTVACTFALEKSRRLWYEDARLTASPEGFDAGRGVEWV
jgi:hypothetical protein